MQTPRVLIEVILVGLLACGWLSGCARPHESTAASAPAVSGNPNGNWQLYLAGSTNGATNSSTNGWQLSIQDQTNNPPK